MKIPCVMLVAALLSAAAPVEAEVLFQAKWDGKTGNNGLDADKAAGSATVLVANGVSLAAGAAGTGAFFPSNTSAKVSLQFDATGNIRNDRGTIEFWYKPAYDATALADANFRLLNVRNTDKSAERFIDLYSSDVNPSGRGGESIALYSQTFFAGKQLSHPIGTGTGQSFSAGDLIHVTLTWDNAKGIQLFVNGAASAFHPVTWAANSHTQDVIFVGSFISGVGLTAAGVIDELTIHDNVVYTEDFTPALKEHENKGK
ncbi:MAG: hypothetical protein HY360_27310 [Verrucomicrobia bacterium]|nr:hypothetical protein [Verrucomicrobiota bacterium]